MRTVLRQVGQRLRGLRAKHKYTQEQLAERAGINATYYGRVERGEANISLELLVPIAAALHVSLAELLDVEKEKDREQITAEIVTMIGRATEAEVHVIYKALRSLFG